MIFPFSNHIYRLSLTLASLFLHQLVLSQDLISKDGENMGPRKYFIYSCAYDENDQIRIDYELGYSNLDFCDCLADDLIPQMTKEEITYYFRGNRHSEVFNNPNLATISRDCMKYAMEKWDSPPPPEEVSIVPETRISPPPKEVTIVSETRTSPVPSVIDSILVIVDYERKFNEIRDHQIEQLEQETKLTNDKVLALKKRINYEDIIQPKVIYNAYRDNSEEDNQAIYAYLRSLSDEELEKTSLLYNANTVLYFEKIIAIRLNEFLSE